ncbi:MULTISPECIES: DNA (cytosine-5-)-methyltransferase [unclassified Flavobacterium]|uniref:DNA (cytosine-5-)-methyltransferase n=1 Tax=unclassified Flavobacterium TaxID=196869 RepID=UPI002352AA05|nr:MULTISPECIES: DNA (cytosine-5-)-methyltransferase [unclassified Flavobacterium]
MNSIPEPKLMLEKINFSIKNLVEKNKILTDKEAVITHFAHTGEFEYEALIYITEILEKEYPDVVFNEEKISELINSGNIRNENIVFAEQANPTFRFIDLFAGIGGFRLALQNIGGKCVFSSEWNNYAKKTYSSNFGEVPFGDITQIDENTIPDHDILVGGFPCQPFSLAGVSKKNALGRNHGFRDETQGTLFFDIVRILETKRPGAFLLENVKNLVSHDKGNTFRIIQGTLNELGYNIHCKVLDGKHFVPQHRERIVIVGFDRNVFNGEENFNFPEIHNNNNNNAIRTILEPNISDKYTLSDKLWNYLQEYAAKHRAKGNGFGYGLTNLNGISRTLSARYYKDGAEILLPQHGRNPRRLTPRECARLQGYPDNFRIPVSDTQAYKQFGNSIVVPLMQAVGQEIVEVLNRNNI